jgi:REP element-mobilizing transposase RayT
MADHCLGPAWYGRKLIRLVGGSLEQEYQWQLKELEALPTHLHQLVKTSPKFQLKPSDITK